MRTTKKLTSIILTLCLVVSVLTVGIVPAAAESTDNYAQAQDTVQGSAILHCFDWSYNSIRSNLADIAAAGYTAIQTSPVQPPKDYGSWTDSAGQWWKLYQPLDLAIATGNSWLGTKDELRALCTAADSYNIKIIVDIVSNHLANNGSVGDGDYLNYLHADVNSELKNADYFFANYGGNSSASRFQMTHGHLGMPELNTANSVVQNKVLDLLKECVDCGVDGFRFDTAKHIELPDDDESTRSDFWPTVINGINSYKSGLYIYGEILGDAYSKDINKKYTTYMDLTDDYTSYLVRQGVKNKSGSGMSSSYYQKGINADQAVLWAESHDTYMNNDGNSKDDTLDTITKTWAFINSRSDATSLFFVRPDANSMGSAGTDTTWKSTVVAESNKFKNAFLGKSEYLSSSGSVAYNERGTKGVVIVNTNGAGSVSLTAHKIVDGTYTDHVSGNTFTVSNGTISGSVGSTGVAIVYNNGDVDDPAITASTLYLNPDHTNWNVSGVSQRYAMYLFSTKTDDTAWVSMTDSNSDGIFEGTVPAGTWNKVIFCRMNGSTTENNWDNKWNQTINLFPTDNNDCFTVSEKDATETSKYTGSWSVYGETPVTTTPQPTTQNTNTDTYTIYVTNNANWSNVYVYYWGDSTIDWPGAPMNSYSGSKVYTYDIPSNVTGLLFNIGSNSKQTGDITSGIKDGAHWIINNTTSSGKYTYTSAPTYYLVGTINNWSDNASYAFSLNPCDEGKEEYKLSSVQLSAGDELKVKDSNNNWYPGGSNNNYNVTADGTYDIYFRPNADGSSSWYNRYFYPVNVTPYTVTWFDGDGDALKTEVVTYGTTPSYSGDTPTKSADAQYTYTFTGWSPAIVPATANATYTAQFEATAKEYTVTWLNSDGTTLATDQVAYGQTPVYSGATPTKEADEQNTYTFIGWSPDVAAVTGDVTYTAQFSSNVNTYTVTWQNDDGTVLETDYNVAVGTTPVFNGETPTKQSTAQYNYTFDGWDPAVEPVAGDITYTAKYTETVNTYTVHWVDENNVELETDTDVPYGTLPEYNGEAPTKDADLQYTYSFTGWSPAVTEVTDDVTYRAQFEANPVPCYHISATNVIGWDNVYVYYWLGENNNSWPGVPMTANSDHLFYSADIPSDVEGIIFNNGDTGNMKQTANITDDIADNASWIVCSHNNNVKLNKDKTYYLVGSINNWSTESAPAFTLNPTDNGILEYKLTDISLTAGDTLKVKDSTGTWYPQGGDTANYTVASTGTYDIYFRPNGDGNNSWHQGYFVLINKTPCTVTWVDGNGNTLKTDTLIYGETPAYTGDTPLKSSDAQYSYTFSGWSPEIEPVTEDITYYAQFSSTTNEYTITWRNDNGDILKTDTLAYGETPEYTGETPAREADAQYTYTFSGWSPDINPVTGDAEYTAVYQSTVNEYTVTWTNYDDSVLATDTLPYGTFPVYSGDTPVRETTDQYTYTFIGWTPEPSDVYGTMTFKATFQENVRTYTVTWQDGNGNVLYFSDVPYGEMPAYNGDTPLKPSDAQYSYTFSGWSPEIETVTGDAVYTAQFTESLNSYPVVWINDDGTVLDSQTVPYGVVPVYSGETPTKEGNAHYSYAFKGWQPDITAVIGSMTYQAVYDEIENTYTVTWQDEDGTLLDEGTFTYGEMPAYSGAAPQKAETDQYTYTFNGWNPVLNPVTEDAVYTAQYTQELRSYTVSWRNDDYTEICTTTVPYGETPVFPGADPTKPSTLEYTYTFSGWSPAIVPVTGDAEYTAVFTSTVNKYTVNWYNYNGQLLDSQEVNYGDTPEYNGDEPQKGSDTYNTYSFNGWSPAVVPVESNADYYAQYIETPIEYTVSWVDYDGTPLYEQTYHYYDNPMYPLTPPTREADVMHTYQFADWDPYVQPVTQDITYTARYTDYPRYYTVRWLDDNGYELCTSEVPYGETPSYPYSEPIKQSTQEFTYTFSGWSPELAPIYSDAEYTAQYNETRNYYEVFWYDDDNTQLDHESYAYGDTPYYKLTAPSKAPDEYNHYVFNGWYPTEQTVTGNTSYTAQYISTPHTYSVSWNWAADYSAAEATLTCDACGKTVTLSADVNAQYYSDKTEYTATLTYNGEEYSDTQTASYKLFTGHSLTLRGDIGLNFFLNITDDEVENGNIIVDFEWYVNETRKTASVTLSDQNRVGIDRYKATCYVPAAEMTYAITATVTKNGVQADETNTYTVRSYADYILHNEKFIKSYKESETALGRNGDTRYQQLTTLVQTMLDFGANAQLRFERNTEDLANGGSNFFTNEITASDINAPSSDMTADLNTYGLSYVGSTIIYLSKTTLRHYYTIEDENAFKNYKNSLLLDGETVSYGKRDGMIYFEITDIPAEKLNVAHTLKIGTTTYSYSALSYIKKLLDRNPDGVSAELAKATYRYHLAAVDYFQNVTA